MHAVSTVLRLSRSDPGLLAMAVVVLTGCGSAATVITGLVTLDGEPVPQAALEFFPMSGKGRVSFTRADDAGRYRVTVSPTKLSVVVTATKADGQEKNPTIQTDRWSTAWSTTFRHDTAIRKKRR
jgi:FlaG/FlaF family flagellin (archaellin)